MAPRALVHPERHASDVGQLDEIAQFGRGHEPLEVEVGAVDDQDCCRALADGARVVLGVGAVGAPNLHQPGPGRGHDLGQAERTADLDELPARDDHLAAGGVGGEQQYQRCGVVGDDGGGLGAEVAGQALHHRGEPFASGTGVQVVLERQVAGHVGGEARRAPQVGVDQHTGRVEDLGVGGRLAAGQQRLRLGHQRGRRGRRLPLRHPPSGFGQDLPHRRSHGRCAVALARLLELLLGQEAMNGGEPGEGVGHRGILPSLGAGSHGNRAVCVSLQA